MRTLLVRADGGARIGLGHVMRCRALAEAWIDSGGEARFASSGEDAAATTAIARAVEAEWVVVDGYHFGADFVDTLHEAGLRVLFLDDYGHAERYSADLVLNQNLHASADLYTRRSAGTRLLLGPRYALLRREFRCREGRIREVRPDARRVLVTLGGSDPGNATGLVMSALQCVKLPRLEVAIVVGPANSHVFGALPDGWSLHRAPACLADLMEWADIAIAAGGVTSWELASMGVPQLILTIADNQAPIANSIHAAGIGIYAGAYSACSAGEIARRTEVLLADTAFRSQAALRGQSLVDGQGAARVAELLG